MFWDHSQEGTKNTDYNPQKTSVEPAVRLLLIVKIIL